MDKIILQSDAKVAETSKLDLYQTIIDAPDKNIDIKGSLIDFIQKLLEDQNSTDDQRLSLARLRAYIDINLK